MIQACGEPATMCVYLDGDGPPTPMCTKHGTIYSEDADYRWSQYRADDEPRRCGFIVWIEKGVR